MTSRDYLNAYIERHGGLPATAEFLNIPYPTLAAIANGSRGISKRMAERMVLADPLLDANRLVWVRPIKAA